MTFFQAITVIVSFAIFFPFFVALLAVLARDHISRSYGADVPNLPFLERLGKHWLSCFCFAISLGFWRIDPGD